MHLVVQHKVHVSSPSTGHCGTEYNVNSFLSLGLNQQQYKVDTVKPLRRFLVKEKAFSLYDLENQPFYSK